MRRRWEVSRRSRRPATFTQRTASTRKTQSVTTLPAKRPQCWLSPAKHVTVLSFTHVMRPLMLKQRLHCSVAMAKGMTQMVVAIFHITRETTQMARQNELPGLRKQRVSSLPCCHGTYTHRVSALGSLLLQQL